MADGIVSLEADFDHVVVIYRNGTTITKLGFNQTSDVCLMQYYSSVTNPLVIHLTGKVLLSDGELVALRNSKKPITTNHEYATPYSSSIKFPMFAYDNNPKLKLNTTSYSSYGLI